MNRNLSLLFVAAVVVMAQSPGSRVPKSVPPPGIEVPAQDRSELEGGLQRLGMAIEKVKTNPLLPDVMIYHEAVRYALQYNEFLKADEIAKARQLLKEGENRAAQLSQGQSPWATATGLIVRGYVSKIDKSVQPYGLVIPATYSSLQPHKWRLDAWFHGRSETLTEINFLSDRERNTGEFTPANTIVLHLYGRFCNASRFAGEVDFFEAMEAVKRQYAIDENRILVRGFSMGGGTVWHLATHYGGMWAAAAPGAGFSETSGFLRLPTTGDGAPPAWEQTLWHMYDATDYAANLYNTPIVAYNGEIDGQKQAADMMERAMAEEGMTLRRVIGPGTAHKYHPDSKVQLEKMMDSIAERGRDPYPRKIQFTTWTLAYNRMKWAVIDGLEKHWERARLDVGITPGNIVEAQTKNVTAFTLEMAPGGPLLASTQKQAVMIDGQKLVTLGPQSDRSWTAHFRRTGVQWSAVNSPEAPGLQKRHGLQGPVDDAFLDSFVFVSPTGRPLSASVGAWAAAEEKRAITEWRRQFRGEAQVREDKQITDADIASSNLILWGDPGSNLLLARIADRLPVRWTADAIIVGKQSFSSSTHAPVLIYPNPLNPNKYVVLNSGFTFREFDYLNNARQTPKLPDYAIIDTTVPPNDRNPGKIVLASFFDEDWKLR
jgi:dienelactone hydrolase